MKLDIKGSMPKKIDVMELFARDGIQAIDTYLPVETKVWFINEFIACGYKHVEVTNFSHPKFLVQSKDAEDVLAGLKRVEGIHYKTYGMTPAAAKRAVAAREKGHPVDSMALTISAADLHGMRNSGRTRDQYKPEIKEMFNIFKGSGLKLDMAIACVYGSPCDGPVPVENTVDLIKWGLDNGIRDFTPCDTTGESNPVRSYEYMARLVDEFGKYDNEATYRIAHFHDTRGMGLANTFACIMGGARLIEASLGALGGQPAFIVDNFAGKGTGPNYLDGIDVGNCSSEDMLVMLDELGIETGIDIMRMLALGRVLEQVLRRKLRPFTSKNGPCTHGIVEWNDGKQGYMFVPPWQDGYFCYPKDKSQLR